MGRERFVVNCGVKMPIGFRFLPTEEELVLSYLKPKVMNLPFPASVIPHFDVFTTDPWGLPGDLSERKRYFFSNSGKVNGVDKIATGCGYWKSIGKQKMIFGPESNKVVGTRQTLVFKEKKKHPQPQYCSKNRWFLHQFSLLTSPTFNSKPAEMEMQDWVVYSLFQKKRKPKKNEGMRSEMGLLPHPQASSCSSGVTDQDCSNELPTLDQEASSIYINVFSCMREDH